MIDAKECLTSALTLLSYKGVITIEEVEEAGKTGFQGLQDLLNDKYIEMVKSGEITP